MTTTTYTVEGLTCGFCMAEVMERIHMLPGVTCVAVGLVPGGRSPLVVTSGSAMPVNEVYQAVENAGFDLTGIEGRFSVSTARQAWDAQAFPTLVNEVPVPFGGVNV